MPLRTGAYEEEQHIPIQGRQEKRSGCRVVSVLRCLLPCRLKDRRIGPDAGQGQQLGRRRVQGAIVIVTSYRVPRAKIMGLTNANINAIHWPGVGVKRKFSTVHKFLSAQVHMNFNPARLMK